MLLHAFKYEQVATIKTIKENGRKYPRKFRLMSLKNASIIRWVTRWNLPIIKAKNLTFVLTLHDGSKCELVVNELHI
ncbi:YjeJ family protein [Shigella flexneri]